MCIRQGCKAVDKVEVRPMAHGLMTWATAVQSEERKLQAAQLALVADEPDPVPVDIDQLARDARARLASSRPRSGA
jgi:hypothetical protein